MIAHGNLPGLAKRVANRRLAVQVFRMHIHAYNLRIFIGGIIVKALIRIAAGGIDCIVILAVRCLYAAARHLHGTQNTEKLGNAALFVAFRFDMKFGKSGADKAGL